MLDNISEARLGEVMPELVNIIRNLADQLAMEGIFIKVTQGLRTWDDQDKLYAIGRTLPGREVTNAQGGESWHNYGAAIDVVPLEGTIPDWDASHPSWARIVALGEAQGLRSGISWHDMPHFELTGPFPPDPPQEVRDLYRDGGVEAVWKAINS
jgi:peptidoglycan LD-endopeptidase CwlK